MDAPLPNPSSPSLITKFELKDGIGQGSKVTCSTKVGYYKGS